MIIAALLATGAVQVSPTDYPAPQVWAAFTSACADLENPAETERKLSAQGWEAFTPSVGSRLSKLVAMGEAVVPTESAGAKLTMRGAFRREVSGEALELLITRVSANGTTIDGCRLYDFEENRPIPVSFLTKALGRAPSKRDDEPGLFDHAEWEPGYHDGHISTELFFVPKQSPAVTLLGISGISIVAQAAKELD